MPPTPSWRSSRPPTSRPSWPASRRATPSSPPAKKPRKLWPIPSIAPSRPWADMLTSSCPAPTGHLSASGACPPPPARIPSPWKRRPRPIGNYSDASKKRKKCHLSFSTFSILHPQPRHSLRQERRPTRNTPYTTPRTSEDLHEALSSGRTRSPAPGRKHRHRLWGHRPAAWVPVPYVPRSHNP